MKWFYFYSEKDAFSETDEFDAPMLLDVIEGPDPAEWNLFAEIRELGRVIRSHGLRPEWVAKAVASIELSAENNSREGIPFWRLDFDNYEIKYVHHFEDRREAYDYIDSRSEEISHVLFKAEDLRYLQRRWSELQ